MDGTANTIPGRGPAAKTRWMRRGLFTVVCVIVPAIYLWSANPGPLEQLCQRPADTYYNLLVQGFRAGQLNLKQEPPPGLAQLPDPYDPDANLPFRWIDPHPVHDLSYFQGKLYLYFGITPALVLFWPYTVLTGHYLLHEQAAVIFFAAGFLAGAGLLMEIRRRCFPEAGDGVVAAGLMALGLASGVPLVVARSDVYEVAISCGYALTMLSLAALWRSLLQPAGRNGWLALASLGFGLAVGARPSLLPGAAILLVPVIVSWRDSRRIWIPLTAAAGPLALMVGSLLVYNFLRFHNALEFGMRYQLSTVRLDSAPHFAARYLWGNLNIYFLEPAQWTAHFPFVHSAPAPRLPVGHFPQIEYAFGVLANTPVVWLALALPLAWRVRSAGAQSLRWFVGAVALFCGISSVTLLLFFATTARYEMDFLPELVLLAVIGMLGLESALAGRPGRRVARLVWGSALAISVGFSIFASFDRHADAQCRWGATLEGRGRLDEALDHYRAALRFNPDNALAHSSLAVGLARTRRPEEALVHFQTAVALQPDYPPFHYNLATFLFRNGRVDDAIAQYRRVLEIEPVSFEARRNLGSALLQTGRVPEAVANYERALEINPGFNGAYADLSRAAWLLATSPDATLRNGRTSLRFAQQAERISGGADPLTAVTLAAAYAETGQFPEAITSAQRALQLSEARTNAALAAAARMQITNYQAGLPLRDDGRRPLW